MLKIVQIFICGKKCGVNFVELKKKFVKVREKTMIKLKMNFMKTSNFLEN